MLYLINVKSFIKFEYKPKKDQSQLTNMIVYDLQSFCTDKVVPYAICIYRLDKISGKENRGITERENEKCRKDCIVSKATVSINELLDHVLQIKGEAKKVNNEIV